jgi:hypothetical protein
MTINTDREEDKIPNENGDHEDRQREDNRRRDLERKEKLWLHLQCIGMDLAEDLLLHATSFL